MLRLTSLQLIPTYQHHGQMSQDPDTFGSKALSDYFNGLAHDIPCRSSKSVTTLGSNLTNNIVDIVMAPAESIESVAKEMKEAGLLDIQWLRSRNESWYVLLYHARQEVFLEYISSEAANPFKHPETVDSIRGLSEKVLDQLIEGVLVNNASKMTESETSSDSTITADLLDIWVRREFLCQHPPFTLSLNMM